ncbi:hypothetical protein DFH06DRAFT_1298836 [Mycena polygramma]|nr:hypothetical protein DFH06DRAFT_1298836 [Mycena polygramma]
MNLYRPCDTFPLVPLDAIKLLGCRIGIILFGTPGAVTTRVPYNIFLFGTPASPANLMREQLPKASRTLSPDIFEVNGAAAASERIYSEHAVHESCFLAILDRLGQVYIESTPVFELNTANDAAFVTFQPQSGATAKIVQCGLSRSIPPHAPSPDGIKYHGTNHGCHIAPPGCQRYLGVPNRIIRRIDLLACQHAPRGRRRNEETKKTGDDCKHFFKNKYTDEERETASQDPLKSPRLEKAWKLEGDVRVSSNRLRCRGQEGHGERVACCCRISEAEEMSEVLMLQWVKAGVERASSPSKISYWKDHCGWGREGGVSFNRGLPQWFIKGPTCASRQAQGQREATMFLKFDWSHFYYNNLKPTSVEAVTSSCPTTEWPPIVGVRPPLFTEGQSRL